ncbi:hypothetical protein PEBR_42571 [Penicillium brasilianum]|uniref:Uncharacterized protein n=1 Tax=Penicillium brasilianum TaxID=104259 RepID=A0A1S9R7S7_PENBI|nr:hypothetical protein PEBR_42571 [Penicillium brasilianum]
MVFHLFGLRALEVWLYGRLIRSPLFHQMVGRVHQRVEQIRHGIPPEPSRTTLEEKGIETRSRNVLPPCTVQLIDDHLSGSLDKFVRYFKEEIQDQMKGKPSNKL